MTRFCNAVGMDVTVKSVGRSSFCSVKWAGYMHFVDLTWLSPCHVWWNRYNYVYWWTTHSENVFAVFYFLSSLFCMYIVHVLILVANTHVYNPLG